VANVNRQFGILPQWRLHHPWFRSGASLSGDFGKIPHDTNTRKIFYNTSPDSSVNHFRESEFNYQGGEKRMNRDEILDLIINHSREVVPKLENHQFSPGDILADLGANSVDRSEIIMMTMEALALQVPRVELFGANNIGELADVFYEKLQSS